MNRHCGLCGNYDTHDCHHLTLWNSRLKEAVPNYSRVAEDGLNEHRYVECDHGPGHACYQEETNEAK